MSAVVLPPIEPPKGHVKRKSASKQAKPKTERRQKDPEQVREVAISTPKGTSRSGRKIKLKQDFDYDLM